MFKMITLLVLSFTLMAEDAPVMPLEVEKGMAPFQSRINAKIIEMNKIKIEEITYLEKSMKAYIAKTTDLDGAKVIKDRIEAIKKEIEVSDPISAGINPNGVIESQVVGRWFASIPTMGYTSTWTINADHTVLSSNGNMTGKWEVVKDKVKISWPNGCWEEIHTPINNSHTKFNNWKAGEGGGLIHR